MTTTSPRSINPDLYRKDDAIVPLGVTAAAFGLCLLRHITLETTLVATAILGALLAGNTLSRRLSIDGPQLALRKYWWSQRVRLDRLARVCTIDDGGSMLQLELRDRDGGVARLSDHIARVDGEIWRRLQCAYFSALRDPGFVTDEAARQFFTLRPLVNPR